MQQEAAKFPGWTQVRIPNLLGSGDGAWTLTTGSSASGTLSNVFEKIRNNRNDNHTVSENPDKI